MKPPAPDAPPALDNVQILLQRRAELAKNKSKYSLTETDAQLLSTHATEVHFQDGQIIIEDNQDIDSVYRIKSGQVAIICKGNQVNAIGKGWFIGDPMLIYDTPAYTYNKTMKAIGNVVLDKLNLSFIKELFKVDLTLKARVMRHIASKFSALYEMLMNNIDSPYLKYTTSSPADSIPSSPSLSSTSSSSSDLNPETAKILTAELSNNNDLFSLPSSESSSSLSSESSSSSLDADGVISDSSSVSSSSLSSPSTPTSDNSNTATPQFKSQLQSKERRNSKREVRAREHAAYKSYPLVGTGGGVQTLHLKSKKLNIVSKSFGFHFKTTVEYSKIVNLTKVGDNATTILYQPRKVANIFFKNYHEREEFLGLVNSLMAHIPEEPSKRLSGQGVGVTHNPELNYADTPLCQGDGKEYSCDALTSTEKYKKGDVVFEQGDLFQRVYLVSKGYCEIHRNGKQICTMEEGDIFGVGTLLHLRPIPITLIAGSDEVDIMMIPAYKLNAMIDTDAGRAASIYKDSAIALDRKISQVLGYLPNHKRILREASQKKGEELEKESAVTPTGDDVITTVA